MVLCLIWMFDDIKNCILLDRNDDLLKRDASIGLQSFVFLLAPVEDHGEKYRNVCRMSILSVGGQKQRNTAFSLSERRPEHRTLCAFRVFKRVEYPTVRVRFALLFRISFRRVPDSYQPRPADEEKGASVHSSPIRTCRYRAASVRPTSRSGDARGLLPIPSRRPPAVINRPPGNSLASRSLWEPLDESRRQAVCLAVMSERTVSREVPGWFRKDSRPGPLGTPGIRPGVRRMVPVGIPHTRRRSLYQARARSGASSLAG